MSLKKIGVLALLFGILFAPVFVSASSSRDYDSNRDNNREYNHSSSMCDTHGTGSCSRDYYDYGYSYPYNNYSYTYPSYNSSYSYPQQYRAPQYNEKSPNVSLTVISLPNTGFEPKSVAALTFALIVLLGIGWVLSPYVRKAFTVVLR